MRWGQGAYAHHQSGQGIVWSYVGPWMLPAPLLRPSRSSLTSRSLNRNCYEAGPQVASP